MRLKSIGPAEGSKGAVVKRIGENVCLRKLNLYNVHYGYIKCCKPDFYVIFLIRLMYELP